MTKEEMTRSKSLSSIKEELFRIIEAEQSLDTLREWLSMYDEARFVASINSKEPELKEYHSKRMSEFKTPWSKQEK